MLEIKRRVFTKKHPFLYEIRDKTGLLYYSHTSESVVNKVMAWASKNGIKSKNDWIEARKKEHVFNRANLLIFGV